MTFTWLVRLAGWLNTRFPPKFVVTQEVYDATQERQYRHSKDIATLQGDCLRLRERVEQLEKSHIVLDRIEAIESRQAEIAKMLASPKKSESEILREQFVRGELSRLPPRGAVEKESLSASN